MLGRADIQIGGSRPWDIQVKNEKLYDRIASTGKLGLGEAYVEGWWDCEAVDQFISRVLRTRLHSNMKNSFATRLLHLRARLSNMQSKERAKRDVSSHYDIGNDLYFTFLDPYYQYSCAYFEATDDLNQAQEQKLDLICRKLNLKPSDHLLDIGCGWGGLAYFAATNYGCKVTGITLSAEQASFAETLCEELPVNIKLCDYREIQGQFDKVVSVGMFEHVGYKNYRMFMNCVHRSIRPDGLFLLHTIGANRTYNQYDPWLNKYIFPNAFIPSLEQIQCAIGDQFIIEDLHNFGAYYARTLKAWKQNFDHCWHKISDKYGDRFYRMWSYYLLLTSGSFDARYSQLWQFVLSPGGVPEGYRSVR